MGNKNNSVDDFNLESSNPYEKFSNLTQVLDEYCKEMKTYFGDQFQNSSDWLNTVQVEVNIDDKIVNIDIQVPDYYKYIENGRGPGKFPPIVKIQE